MRKLITLKPRGGVPLGGRGATPLRVERITGRRLQARNRRLFEQKPLCGMCLATGIVKAAVVWDHKIPLWQGGPDDETNLQGLCKPHHDAKSAAEAGLRAAGG